MKAATQPTSIFFEVTELTEKIAEVELPVPSYYHLKATGVCLAVLGERRGIRVLNNGVSLEINKVQPEKWYDTRMEPIDRDIFLKIMDIVQKAQLKLASEIPASLTMPESSGHIAE